MNACSDLRQTLTLEDVGSDVTVNYQPESGASAYQREGVLRGISADGQTAFVEFNDYQARRTLSPVRAAFAVRDVTKKRSNN